MASLSYKSSENLLISLNQTRPSFFLHQNRRTPSPTYQTRHLHSPTTIVTSLPPSTTIIRSSLSKSFFFSFFFSSPLLKSMKHELDRWMCVFFLLFPFSGGGGFIFRREPNLMTKVRFLSWYLECSSIFQLQLIISLALLPFQFGQPYNGRFPAGFRWC